jgi:hypothetical protein
MKNLTQLDSASEVFDTVTSDKILASHRKINEATSPLLNVRTHLAKSLGCHLFSFDSLKYPDFFQEDYCIKGEGYRLELSIISYSPICKERIRVKHPDSPIAKDRLIYLFKQDYERRRERMNSPFCIKLTDFMAKLFVLCGEYSQFSFEHDSGYWASRYEDKKKHCVVDCVLQFDESGVKN